MKVSVIVPIYNIPEIPLRQCIESIQIQSYNDLEILLINDGSTTNCLEICNEYCSDKRVRVIDKENAGVSSARNRGIEESTGDFIMFVDADDILISDAIQIMVNASLLHKTDIMICGYRRFATYNSKLNTIENSISAVSFDKPSDLIKLRKKCLKEDNSLEICFNGAPWGKLYTSKIIKHNNIHFDQSLIRSQDNYFNFIIFGLATKVGYINSPLYLYRFLPSSAVNKFRNNLFEISQRYLDKVENRIAWEGIESEYGDTLNKIKLEKFSEYLSLYICHPQNKESLKHKISEIKIAKGVWVGQRNADAILRDIEVPRIKILYRLINNGHYSLAYYYLKTMRQLKQVVLKMGYING